MTRYPMTPKFHSKCVTLGYSLICKICDCPIGAFDIVESKGSDKMYHASCYDGSHIDVPDTTTTTIPPPTYEEEEIFYGKAEEIK